MSKNEIAVFGGGCFWGVEELFERLDGVVSAVSGYMGGVIDSPSYEQVCTGKTGHAEVVQVEFNPKEITYRELLDYFFRMHDPTTLNQQGVDIGNQYRSVVFATSEDQFAQAKSFMERLEEMKFFPRPIVTELSMQETFWPAEDYHQDYYQKKYQGTSGPICHTLNPTSFLEEGEGKK